MRMFDRLVRSGTTEGSGGAQPSEPSGGSAPGGAPPSNDQGASLVQSGQEGGATADDLKRILDFDPFAPPSEGEARRGAEPAQGPPSPTPGTQPQQPPAANQPQQENTESQLAAAARALADTSRQLPEAVREAARPQPQQPQEDPWLPRNERGEPMNYGVLQIPDELVSGIASDNPIERKQALTQLGAGLMHSVHRAVLAHVVPQMRQEFASVLPSFVTEQLRSYNQQQEVFNDFYGKFPMLSNPAIRPVVMEEAKKLAQQKGYQGWTPEFRDALGNHVVQLLRGAVPAQQAPAPAPQGAMTGMAARPAEVGQPQRIDPWDDLFGPSGGFR